MKKKIVWLVVSCLMALSLVMASCGPTAEEEVEIGEAEVVIEEEEEEVEEEIVKEVEKGPKYGGVITLVQTGDPMSFDELTGGVPCICWTVLQTNQELCQADWAKGPAGTGEADYALSVTEKWAFAAGCLAESWEIPEVGTAIFHIRKGVHYALNPDSEASRLVGGRELTAYDIEWSLNSAIKNPGTYMGATDGKYATVTAPDKWTVVIELPDEYFSETWHHMEHASIYPPEVTEKYGSMDDWENSVGTGPFILIDYIPSSSATLVRNPNYWEKDPVGLGKGNQLPYLDRVKFLIIRDASSRMAAFRTGRIDTIQGLWWEDAETLMKTAPQAMSKKYYDSLGWAIGMRQDKPELPYSDVNVRWALMMAIDFETIKNTWAGGEAQILTWPMPYVKEYKHCYLPLEEAPASVQELYAYNPEKARQLLTDAGYPDGFKATLICGNDPLLVDYLSIIQDMWAEVDVEVTLDPLERGALTSIVAARNYENMIQQGPGSIAAYHFAQNFHGEQRFNISYINDPIVEETVFRIKATRMIDEAGAERLHKELMPYLLDQAYQIPPVVPPRYNLWWSWVKNYHGEHSVGCVNFNTWTKYIWFDQDLKTSMGY